MEIRQNGPEEFEDLELITIPELAEIRRIWVTEKHEFDDSLPRIYQEVVGELFPDNSLYKTNSFGVSEWEILREVCDPEKNDGETQLFELMYTLIDIESRADIMNNRKGILNSIETTIKQNFYIDETDAHKFYFDRTKRKRDLGGKYDERAFNTVHDEGEEFLEDEE